MSRVAQERRVHSVRSRLKKSRGQRSIHRRRVAPSLTSAWSGSGWGTGRCDVSRVSRQTAQDSLEAGSLQLVGRQQAFVAGGSVDSSNNASIDPSNHIPPVVSLNSRCRSCKTSALFILSVVRVHARHTCVVGCRCTHCVRCASWTHFSSDMVMSGVVGESKSSFGVSSGLSGRTVADAWSLVGAAVTSSHRAYRPGELVRLARGLLPSDNLRQATSTST